MIDRHVAPDQGGSTLSTRPAGQPGQNKVAYTDEVALNQIGQRPSGQEENGSLEQGLGRLAATPKNARIDSSVPFCGGILAIDRKRKIGDRRALVANEDAESPVVMVSGPSPDYE